MIHYTVAFSFKPGVADTDQLGQVRAFLADLQARGKIASYRLLRNRNDASRSSLPPYKVDVMLRDEASFGVPFAEVAEIGIHSGAHGLMIEHVDRMVVEVFEDIDGPE